MVSEFLDLLGVLEVRFRENMGRHVGLVWGDVRVRLEGAGGKLGCLLEMERTGGEPDVVGFDVKTGEFVFCDCSLESPSGRRGLCYDRLALDSRKANKPVDCVLDVAARMGVELLTEEEYRGLQRFGPFDGRSSSWVVTPSDVRLLGGALFCDFRYGRVFVYHNGADSYYSSRGFRGSLRV